MTNRVLLSAIVFDAGTQVRAAINEQVVSDYADRMREGAEFPPVILFGDGNNHYLADGFHRAMASRRVGRDDISADIRPGTKQDALWFALGANKANGERLTIADKKHAIGLAMKAWPDRGAPAIAQQLGCTEQYVREVRRVVERETGFVLPDRLPGRDGKLHPTSRAASVQRSKRIEEMLREGRSVDAIKKELGGVTNDTIAKVRRAAGLSGGVDRSRVAVQHRKDQMRKMANDGYTSRQIAEAIGVSEEGCRVTMRKEGIEVPADKVTRGTHRHDPNRILDRIAMDADNLTEGVNLIDFNDLDRSRIPSWLASLKSSREKLGAFIRRLMQEQQNHGEAA